MLRYLPMFFSKHQFVNVTSRSSIKTIYVFFSVIVLLTLGSCSTFRTYEVSDNFDKKQFKRVGLLVTRVGNTVAGSVAQITLQTDYNRRIPKPQSTMGLTPNSIDVYIEDESRIKEAIPTYPKYDSAPLQNIGALRKQTSEYFRNITPELYAGISEVFREKGYQVVDINELSKSWEKPLSEMTIEQILDHAAPSIDTLAVFHYMETANSYLYAITVETNTKGLESINYTLSLFNPTTKEEVLFFRPLFAYNIQTVISHDKNILNDPRFKDRINLQESSSQSTNAEHFSSKVSHDLTDEELVEIAVKYICRGVTWSIESSSTTNEAKGLDTVIP